MLCAGGQGALACRSVSDAEVNLALERANVELSGPVTAQKLIEAVEKAGYGATLRSADEARQRKADAEREAARLAEERQTLARFAVSALLSLPLVIGMLTMMLGTGHAWIGPWTQAGLAAGVMLASGTRFYREASTPCAAAAPTWRCWCRSALPSPSSPRWSS